MQITRTHPRGQTILITEGIGLCPVTWGEQVNDEQYGAGRSA
jgi:hypothetical protein